MFLCTFFVGVREGSVLLGPCKSNLYSTGIDLFCQIFHSSRRHPLACSCARFLWGFGKALSCWVLARAIFTVLVLTFFARFSTAVAAIPSHVPVHVFCGGSGRLCLV